MDSVFCIVMIDTRKDFYNLKECDIINSSVLNWELVRGQKINERIKTVS